LSYSQLEKVYEELRKAKFSLSKNDQQKNIYSDQILAQKHTEKDIVSAQETTSTYIKVFPEEKEILRIALTSDNALRYMTQVLGISKEAFLSPSASKLYQYTLVIQY
jgi:phage I-like protein